MPPFFVRNIHTKLNTCKQYLFQQKKEKNDSFRHATYSQGETTDTKVRIILREICRFINLHLLMIFFIQRELRQLKLTPSLPPNIGVDQGNAILVGLPNLNTRPTSLVEGVWKSTCENGPQIRQRRTIPQSTSCLILVDLWTTKPGQLIKMSRFLESPCHKPPIMNNPFHLGFKAVFYSEKRASKIKKGKVSM